MPWAAMKSSSLTSAGCAGRAEITHPSGRPHRWTCRCPSPVYTPDRITVELQKPGAPRVARALALLIDEINHTPPAMPGDTRPITYRITAHQPESNE